MRSPIFTTFKDLPEEISIFPLSGALLLPWGRLPLNVFEPRYLNMALDALKVGRIFGMIQPNYDSLVEAEVEPKDVDDDGQEMTAENIDFFPEAPVYSVGCAGRIGYFEETEDGRLLISLKGLLRFRVIEEVAGSNGYRRVKPDYSDFAADLDAQPDINLDREKLMSILRPYVDAQNMRLKVDVMKGLDDGALVTTLCMICPFNPREKQGLLETVALQDRADMLLTLLEMAQFETSGTTDGRRQ